jgi:hypothetical protein
MSSSNGESELGQAPLELRDILQIQTTDGAAVPFEVVGILEDSEGAASYAVLVHEPEDPEDSEFIVTDLTGNLVEDDTLAQEILDDFLLFAQEADDERDGGGG